MKENELKKELIIHYLENLLADTDRKNEMFNIIQDALDLNLFEGSWECIYPMSRFDDVMSHLKPSQIADLVSGNDMAKSYFAYGDMFTTFSYDEIDKLFSFNCIADAVLEGGYEWSCPFFNHIGNLGVEELRYLVANILVKDDIENIVASFNNFLTETRGCDEQIFTMETDLEEIWFDMMGQDGYFMEQLTTLYESIKSGTFFITDRFWEMTTADGHAFDGIRSFNELYDSTNYTRLEDDYADYLITSRDYDGLSNTTAHKLDELFSSILI